MFRIGKSIKAESRFVALGISKKGRGWLKGTKFLLDKMKIL